ncbi:MAG: hypothetical protein O7G85_01200 [Planctomycetota bacterium]|nr:hypothetical protein [Planctomycetota bacterium]
MNMKTLLIGVGLLVAVAAVFAMPYSNTVPRYAVNPGLLSEPHAFLENRCSACHTPLKGIEASNCIVCHANDEALLQREPTAFHGNIGSCKECHYEHSGRIQHPIAMDHSALSRIGFRQLRDSGDEEFNQGDSLARFLNVGRASSFQSQLNCTACHAKEDPHSSQFGSNCAACHETERWSIATFRHPSPRSQDCAQCHYGPPCHRTTHFREVCAQVADKPEAKVNECYSCHQTTSWNDIKGVGWYKSH